MAPVGGIGAGLGDGVSLPLPLLEARSSGATTGTSDTQSAGGPDFGAVLKSKLSELTSQQADATEATQQMATGQVDDIAKTMLRIEQANVSLQMATQMRNKVVEAYQEITRMQI